MSKKISELLALAAAVDPTDVFPIVHGGSTYKATLLQARGFMSRVKWIDDFAAGDGSTDDTTQINAALAAIGAAGGGALLGGARQYRITGPLLVPGNTMLAGMGPATEFLLATNTQGIRVTGQDAIVRDLRVTCSNGGGGVASQDAISVGPWGVTSGPPRTRILNVTVDGAGQSGVFIAPNDVDVYQHGVLVQGLIAKGCARGVWAHGEYNRIIGCDTYAGTDGIYIPGGNNIVSGCTSTGNSGKGLWLVGGGNDGHGIVNACDLNHNAYNLWAGAVANGMPFVGCNFYGVGNAMMFVGSVGIRLMSCAYDLSDWYFDGSVGTYIDGYWPLLAVPSPTFHHNYNGHASKTIFGRCLTSDGLGDQLAYAFPSDAPQTLTVAQSLKKKLVVSGSLTAPRQITSQLDATIGQEVFVRNTTGQTVNWAWASGTPIGIPTNTAMLVGSDGTNAIKLGAMT